MKTSAFALLCALLASAITGSHARPQPTAAPLEQRDNSLSPRQQDASAIVASIRESPDAFMSSVTASDSTTPFSTATGFACKGLQGSSGCCDTGIYVNRRCYVVPGAEGLSFYGNTDDYVPGQDDDSSSTSGSASTSATASQTSAASTSAGSSSSSNTNNAASTASSQASQASQDSSAAAAPSPSATSQSGGSNDGHSLQASLGLMAASFLGLVVAL